MKVIADFPALRVLEMPEFRRQRITHGQEFAIMFPRISGKGEIPYMFKFGSVFGYAVEHSDDPMQAYQRAVHRDHKLYWAIKQAVVIHNGPKEKRDVMCLAFGDEITFEGRKFRLVKAPNDNVSLVPVE